MAYIDFNSITKQDKEFRKHNPTKATYSINGSLFQIDTYGSDTREYTEKVSQTIQFDIEGAKKLIELLRQNFNNQSIFEHTIRKITISLLGANEDVQYGLNWGQRTGREPNQAYVQLPIEIYRSDFFPKKPKHFLVHTDDGQNIVFTRAQKTDEGTAIQTPEDNSLLGKYLRKRLNVELGKEITKQDLLNYGRTDISFFKIDSSYFMDFSNTSFDETFQVDEIIENNNTSSVSNFSQIIYYGVPGSGKSHKIDEKIKSISNAQKMRVVFHPDYSNADFVGQILPVMLDDGVEYRFKAGPFSRILKRALKNPSEAHYLIIEEINRGNAAAIFGDLFQLLDRKENGWSNYQIENLDLNAFIRSSGDTYSDKKIEPPTVKVGSDDWDENTGIRLPPNLSILATMNTSDQNVFTLDNAFQRRWDMQLVENKFGDTEEEKNQRNAIIEDSNPEITWETFQTAINNKIGSASSEMGLSSLEDKRLGCWFVKNENGKISKEIFANKVLKYLWDDAFKFSRDKIFENCSNFEELKIMFEQNGLNVFTQDLKSEFHKNKDSETSSE